jgi:hypothetical protein
VLLCCFCCALLLRRLLLVLQELVLQVLAISDIYGVLLCWPGAVGSARPGNSTLCAGDDRARVGRGKRVAPFLTAGSWSSAMTWASPSCPRAGPWWP